MRTPMLSSGETTSFADGEREQLESLFNRSACERLGRSEYEYYSTHGAYLPALARLLNATREERDEALREIENL